MPAQPPALPSDLTTRLHALCAWMAAHPEAPHTLASLAARVHISPFHLQREFKRLLGLSPKQYAQGLRLQQLKLGLRQSASLTGAILDAGYGSASRVYSQVDGGLGMTPLQYRQGGSGVAISYALRPTPLGLLLMAASDRGLCFVQFGDAEAPLLALLAAEYPQAQCSAMPPGENPGFEAWMAALAQHLSSGQPLPSLPLDLRGTAFQLKVWHYLQGIPAGQVQSYGDVATALGLPKAVRAVANACGANRVALAVPCHRVIRGNGGLGGYKWGLERKRALLNQERAAAVPR